MVRDMRERLGRMVIGTSRAGEPVTADDLGVLLLTLFLCDYHVCACVNPFLLSCPDISSIATFQNLKRNFIRIKGGRSIDGADEGCYYAYTHADVGAYTRVRSCGSLR